MRELPRQTKPAQPPPSPSLKNSAKAWPPSSTKSPPQGNRGQRRVKAAALSLKSKIEAEVKVYLSVPVIKSELDPLQWWSLHAEELQYLI